MTRAQVAVSFEPVRNLWAETNARRAWSSVFLTPEWQEAWWAEFGDGEQLRLFTIDGGEHPLGIAPMQLKGDVLTFLGDTDLFDYHDFITADDDFYPAFFEAIEGETWRTIELASIPEWSSTFTLLPGAARARGYQVTVTPEDVVPGMRLPLSWDQYLANLRKKDRHELRRKLRRLEAGGEFLVRQSTPETLIADLAMFHELMAESREEKRDFLVQERAAFFERVIWDMQVAGYLRLLFLEIDSNPVAAVLAFDYEGQRLLYNSGYRQAHGPLAVGLMLKALCIKDAIEHGLSYFDLLRGPEPYKYHLGAVDSNIHRIVVRR